MNGTPTLKKNHDYYYQIQGAQEGPGATCLSGHLLARLDYDPTFWDKAYVHVRLHKFYHEYLLPELANPRTTNSSL